MSLLSSLLAPDGAVETTNAQLRFRRFKTMSLSQKIWSCAKCPPNFRDTFEVVAVLQRGINDGAGRSVSEIFLIQRRRSSLRISCVRELVYWKIAQRNAFALAMTSRWMVFHAVAADPSMTFCSSHFSFFTA